MSQRDVRGSLEHIAHHARLAVGFASGRTREDLDVDLELRYSLERLIEIVGEAAARIPVDERRRFSWIPWSRVIGTRARLAHAYDAIDLDILWRIVRENLPELIDGVERALREG